MPAWRDAVVAGSEVDIRAALERVICDGHVIGDGPRKPIGYASTRLASLKAPARTSGHDLVDPAYRNHRATFLVAMALEMVGAQRQQENNWDRHADQPK